MALRAGNDTYDDAIQAVTSRVLNLVIPRGQVTMWDNTYLPFDPTDINNFPKYKGVSLGFSGGASTIALPGSVINLGLADGDWYSDAFGVLTQVLGPGIEAHVIGNSVGGYLSVYQLISLSGPVSTFNGRAGAVTPIQADYDSFFLTPTEGDSAYDALGSSAAAQAFAIQRSNHTGTQLASTISNFDTQVRTNRLDQMAAPTADVSLNSQKITGLQDGSATTDAATFGQLSAAIEGKKYKDPVAVATTANITLSGEQTLDGVLTSGSRVLVKNQSTASQNGIYVSAAGAWIRSVDANTAAEVSNISVLITGGTTGQGDVYTSNTVATLGTDPVTWVKTSEGNATYAADGTTIDLTGITFSVKNDGVTNAKLANMAQATFKGRQAGGGTGDPEDLTAAQAKAALAILSSDISDFSAAVGAIIGTATRNIVTRSFNTTYQISATKSAFVFYTIQISGSSTLSGNSSGRVNLVSDSAGTPTTILGSVLNQLSQALGLTVTLNFSGGYVLSGVIAAGDNVRLNTVNIAGSPTFTYITGTEYILG